MSGPTTPVAAGQVMVAVKGLSVRFGALTAVDRVDLEVTRGEVFGLVGPDGAGKTTTLRVLCGLLDATEGTVQVAGRDVAREPDAVKDRIGYMAQRFGLYSDLTASENMQFYADLFGITAADRRALLPRLLAMTRMEPFQERRAGKLSGGMKQKLALMCTLLHRPEILFLDEPTNGVDPVSRRDFWTLLRQLVADGLTIFVTTAYLDEAERCDRVGLMHRGTLVRCDTPERLKAQLEEECYEVEATNLTAAREQLMRLPGVASVEPAGAALHLFAAPGATTAENLRSSLDTAGLGPAVVARITPSLEDVFIALIRKADHG
jgi:ABC-2 type transport system ATP-binding protein